MKMFMMASMLTIMIMLMFLFISKKLLINKEKMSSFECGLDPFSMGRIPFSIRFFKITLIFLIFDIEIIIILPSPMFMMQNIEMLMSIFCIMIIIISGLLYEWKIGSLNWVK